MTAVGDAGKIALNASLAAALVAAGMAPGDARELARADALGAFPADTVLHLVRGVEVPTAWPAGAPIVSLQLERVFHQERPDRTVSAEPAGSVETTVCLVGADTLWFRVRELLGPLVREARLHEGAGG